MTCCSLGLGGNSDAVVNKLDVHEIIYLGLLPIALRNTSIFQTSILRCRVHHCTVVAKCHHVWILPVPSLCLQ